MRKFALLAAAAILALPAAAQDRTMGQRIRLPIPLSRPDAANATPADPKAAEEALGNLLSKPFQDVANLINGDLDDAIKLSTQIPELQDGNGQQCWMALKQFGSVVKAHPLPLTGHAVTDLEAARLMAMSANNLCSNAHCTQVFADLANAAQKVNAASGLPGAGAIQVPSLNSLCSNVPVVVVAAPVSIPAPAPTPAAVSTPATAPPAAPTTAPANQ